MAISKALTLSIIIPAYNEERYLGACLDSIAAQTIRPDEVIVVDNNSTDKTAEIARSYEFVTLISEKQQGVVFARNAGFDYANSQLLGRIDSDTILPPNWVKNVLNFYSVRENIDHALSGGAYFYNAKLGRFFGWWQGQIAFRMNRLLLGHYVFFGSNGVVPIDVWKIVKPKVCNEIGLHEDLDLAIHLHEKGFKITYKESMKVGVEMRRVFENRQALWENLFLWPKTLKKHNIWTWPIAWLGALFIYEVSLTHSIFKKN